MDGLNFLGDNSDFASNLASFLQDLRSELVHNSSSVTEQLEEQLVVYDNIGQMNTETLDKSEISTFIRHSAGLINQTGKERPDSVTAMVCARQIGMTGSISFSNADCCKINNNFLPNKSSVAALFPTKIYCGTYLNNGKTFLSASQDKVIRLFDTIGNQFHLVKTIAAKDVGWSILDVAISPDGNYLAYSSWSECLQICKIQRNSENSEALLLCPVDRKFCVFSLRFSSNGKEILCGANDGYIYVYDRECKKRVLEIVGHDNDVNAIAFADERSQILFSGGDDGICQAWDRRMLNQTNPKSVGCLAGHKLGLTYIEPRGDGRHLITNSKDQSIKLWDIRKFSTIDGVQNALRAVAVQNWDYRWKKVPKSLNDPHKRLEGDSSIMTYRGHSVYQTLCRCHFSPMETTGQRYIYTGCAAGRVIIYDVLTGKIEKELTGHRDCVRDAAWHPHKPEITSVSWDGKIIRWFYRGKHWMDSEEEDEIELNVENSVKRKKSQRSKRSRK